MAVTPRVHNSADAVPSQARPSLALDPGRDDLLLTAAEILEAWGINNRRLRRLVQAGTLQRVRRISDPFGIGAEGPSYQPYYPLSSVVAILGRPKHDPTPRYAIGFEGEIAA